MSDWSLERLLANLHDDIHRRLETARQSFGHPGAKGDASDETYGWPFLTRTCPNDTRLPKPMLWIATEHSVIRSMWSYTTGNIRLSSSDTKSRPSSLLRVCTRYSRPSRRSIKSTSSMHARRWPACVGFTGPACRFPMQEEPILLSGSFPYVVAC